MEEAISALGSGFLIRSSNVELLERLQSGALSTQDYYRQLLRLVYRMIFLFAAEDRDLLLDPEAEPEPPGAVYPVLFHGEAAAAGRAAAGHAAPGPLPRAEGGNGAAGQR